MSVNLKDPRILKIITEPGDTTLAWKSDLERLQRGDATLTRKSAGESSIEAIQRMMIFLGYSTSSTGAFSIDGDFGRGTNRGVAQFQFDHGLNKRITRDILTYDCTWRTASQNIVAIPDVRFTVKTMEAMLATATQAIANNEVACGSFDEAMFHLDALHKRTGYKCRQILERYGNHVTTAVQRIKAEKGATVNPRWILSIIRQETAGVVRPRFEQHLLTKYSRKNPQTDLTELRYQSMSFGLGQILGVNYKTVGAASARAMFTSPIDEQVLFVGRFLVSGGGEVGRAAAKAVVKKNPSQAEYRAVARYYNGPGYEKHHYHERLESWFREFTALGV